MSNPLIIILVIIVACIVWLMFSIVFGAPSTKNPPKNQNGIGKDTVNSKPFINVEHDGVVNVSEEDDRVNIEVEQEIDPWLDYEPEEEEISPIEGTYDKNYWRNWDRIAFSQKASEKDEKNESEATKPVIEESKEQAHESQEQEQPRFGVFKDDYELLPFTDSPFIEY